MLDLYVRAPLTLIHAGGSRPPGRAGKNSPAPAIHGTATRAAAPSPAQHPCEPTGQPRLASQLIRSTNAHASLTYLAWALGSPSCGPCGRPSQRRSHLGPVGPCHFFRSLATGTPPTTTTQRGGCGRAQGGRVDPSSKQPHAFLHAPLIWTPRRCCRPRRRPRRRSRRRRRRAPPSPSPCVPAPPHAHTPHPARARCPIPR